MACNEVSGCTGIFMVYGNGHEFESCYLLNITRLQNIFVNETPSGPPAMDPWLQFYNNGDLDFTTAVLIRCEYPNYKINRNIEPINTRQLPTGAHSGKKKVEWIRRIPLHGVAALSAFGIDEGNLPVKSVFAPV